MVMVWGCGVTTTNHTACSLRYIPVLVQHCFAVWKSNLEWTFDTRDLVGKYYSSGVVEDFIPTLLSRKKVVSYVPKSYSIKKVIERFPRDIIWTSVKTVAHTPITTASCYYGSFVSSSLKLRRTTKSFFG